MDEEVAPWHNCCHGAGGAGQWRNHDRSVSAWGGRRGIDPRRVRVPGIFVDYMIVDPTQGMTYGIGFDPALSGESRNRIRISAVSFQPAQSDRPPRGHGTFSGAVLNLGFGVPDGVMKVAREQGFADQVVRRSSRARSAGFLQKAWIRRCL